MFPKASKFPLEYPQRGNPFSVEEFIDPFKEQRLIRTLEIARSQTPYNYNLLNSHERVLIVKKSSIDAATPSNPQARTLKA